MSAETQLLYKNYAESQRLSAAVLARHPDNKRALMTYGWSEFKLGNYEDALNAFRRAAAIENDEDYGPKSAIAWTKLKLGELDEAEALFREAAAKPRHYYERWEIEDGLGWIAYLRNDLDTAERYFDWRPHAMQALLDLYGEFGPVGMGWQRDTFVGRGLVALKRNQLAKAREHFADGIDTDSEYFRNYDGLARAAFLEGEFDKALAQAVAAAERVDFDESVAHLLEAILQKIGSPDRAIKIFTSLLEDRPTARAYHGFLGRAHLRAGDLRQAEKHFVRALEFDSKNARVSHDLARVRREMNKPVRDGWVRYFNGDYKGALAIFQAKLRHETVRGNPAAANGVGWAQLSLSRVSESRDTFQQALKIDPEFASAKEGLEATKQPHLTLYAQAWAFADAGKYESAKRQFDRARSWAPKAFRWKIDDGFAWLAFYRRDLDAAEAAFHRILKTEPKAYLSRKGLAYVALRRGDHGAAAEHLFASLAQEPKQVLTSYTVPALGFLEARKFKTAKKLLDLGNRAYPESADIQFLLARAYKGLNNPAMAVEMAVRAALQAPVYIHPAFDDLGLEPARARNAYLAMAKGLYLAGDYSGAIARVNDYVKAGGADTEAIRVRGFALFRVGRFKDALPDLETAARAEPTSLSAVSEVVPIPGTDQRWPIQYDARSTLGWAHFRLGNQQEAVKWFRRVVETDPNWIDALTGLGYALHAAGDDEGALRNFRSALIVSPGYPDAWQGMRLLTDRQ